MEVTKVVVDVEEGRGRGHLDNQRLPDTCLEATSHFPPAHPFFFLDNFSRVLLFFTLF